MAVGSTTVQVLGAEETEKYLGRKLYFKERQGTELQNRMAVAWAAFHQHKSELCSKHYPLRDRVRLFEAVVKPAALYGCSSWALTSKMRDLLKVIRRRMHRKKTGPNPEDWIDYMRRSAGRVDEVSTKFVMEDWITAYRKKKWNFAGKIAPQNDDRWSKGILDWRPYNGHGRCQGRPKTRWSHDVDRLAGASWSEVAADANLWKCLETGFLKGC